MKTIDHAMKECKAAWERWIAYQGLNTAPIAFYDIKNTTLIITRKAIERRDAEWKEFLVAEAELKKVMKEYLEDPNTMTIDEVIELKDKEQL